MVWFWERVQIVDILLYLYRQIFGSVNGTPTGFISSSRG
jgi:hypothetical protein